MLTQKSFKKNLPVDPLMRRMSRENPFIIPVAPEKPSAGRPEEDALKLQSEWRLFNIQRQAKGLRPLGFEEFLQQKN